LRWWRGCRRRRLFRDLHARSFILRHRDELIALRFFVRGTPYRNENEHGCDCGESGNRDAPSSIPRDFRCCVRVAGAVVGASDIRQHQLASHAIGKMRFETLTLRRRQRTLAVSGERLSVSAFGRRRTGLGAHRTAQNRVERLVISVVRRHVVTIPYSLNEPPPENCTGRVVSFEVRERAR
jgi:hypothetical protein